MPPSPTGPSRRYGPTMPPTTGSGATVAAPPAVVSAVNRVRRFRKSSVSCSACFWSRAANVGLRRVLEASSAASQASRWSTGSSRPVCKSARTSLRSPGAKFCMRTGRARASMTPAFYMGRAACSTLTKVGARHGPAGGLRTRSSRAEQLHVEVPGQADGAGAHHCVVIPAEDRARYQSQATHPRLDQLHRPGVAHARRAFVGGQFPHALAVQLTARQCADPLVTHHFDGLDLEGDVVGKLTAPLDAIRRAESLFVAGAQFFYGAHVRPPARPVVRMIQRLPDCVDVGSNVPIRYELKIGVRCARGRVHGDLVMHLSHSA